jgi:Domain of unknown function (DUF4224)
MWLTPAELVDATGFTQPAAQARELAHLGIPHRRRRDGRVLVLREDVRQGKSEGERRPQLRLQ